MSRLEVLKSSLEKKETKFYKKLDEHFADVKSTNGQPLNDKRNGVLTMQRWEKQNESLTKLEKEIEKTKDAIQAEEWKLKNTEQSRNNMPKELIKLINDGILKQWRKYPHIMFVDGVEKARIIWDENKKMVMHKFTNTLTDKEQRKKFAQIYNALHASINLKAAGSFDSV